MTRYRALAARPTWRRPRGVAALVLATLLLGLPALPGAVPAAGAQPAPRGLALAARQDLSERAVFETVVPEAQWSPRGATEWQSVAIGEIVNAGDRVRTGPDARARLIYFEGTAIELGPSTGLLVVRLERTGSGDLLTNLFQAAGTTVSRVRALVDPAARFEIDTPAATALVRGTTPRVQVAADGTTRVANEPDGSGGLVDVRARDPGASAVSLAPGEETDVAVGQPPLPPVPIGTLPPFAVDPAAPANVPTSAPAAPAVPAAPPAPPVAIPPDVSPAIPVGPPALPAAPPAPAIPVPSTLAPSPTPPRTATPVSAGGSVQGVVRDAATGRPLAGATVGVAGGPSATTDSSGRYTLGGVTPGQAQLSASASGYVSDRAAVAVPASSAATLAFALSAAIPEGQLRIILTWGERPRDLDSHLYVPLGNETAELYFGNRGSLTTRPFAALDVDDTNGLGPETITIGQLQRGRYTYAVYQFSTDGALAQSGARVQVIRGSSVVQSFTVPAGSGRWWTVFTIDASGQITPVNQLGNTPPR
jgi:hypothetical protein